MKSKRDVIAEVLSRKERHFKKIPRLTQTERRFFDLEGAIYLLNRQSDFPARHKRELYRHVPVALIAISEGYFRMLYRDLIDSGEPYLSAAGNFRDVKLDITSLVGAQKRSITLGDLISHQLGHSSLGDIESNLSILLNQDFSIEFTKRLKNEDGGDPKAIFEKQLRRLIVYIFSQRHIYCHELATTVSPRKYELETSIKAFRVYISLIEMHIAEYTKCPTVKGVAEARNEPSDCTHG